MPATFPVTCHTDHVGRGSTFVAIKGFKEDGVKYIVEALHRGASTIVVEHDVIITPAAQSALKVFGAQLVRVGNARKSLAQLAAQAAGSPARALSIIGVTGTKGKTTTVHLTAHLLRQAGYRTALVSSVYTMIDGDAHRSPLTTPQADYLHQFLAQCVARGVTHVVMEVAAQAVTLYRTHGILFDAVIFTNFSLEHLEFYASMDDYFAAKKQLCTQRRIGAPLFVNGDNAACAALAHEYPHVISFGTQQSTVPITITSDGAHPVTCTLECDGITYAFSSPACIGHFNGYNTAAAVLAALHVGIKPDVAQKALLSFSGVPGRMERYRLRNGAIAIIDYAHNPASYEALLSTLRVMTQQLIVVFGAAGERDASRRPLMGRIAAAYADCLVITQDNSRSEDPQSIIKDVKTGIMPDAACEIFVELDRERAIALACAHAQSGAIIALLGKGPDEYQIIGARKFHFSERAILESLGASAQL